MSDDQLFIEGSEEIEDAWECQSCWRITVGHSAACSCGAPEADQDRVFAKPLVGGGFGAWTYPGMDRDEYVEWRRDVRDARG